MLFIDNLDHKPTIHRISANTPQKVLHRIDLQEYRGELWNKKNKRVHIDLMDSNDYTYKEYEA